MKKELITFIMLMLIGAVTAPQAVAHCEIPCGIYDDETRARLIAEHAQTIEKSMKQTMALSKENPINYNQVVRWIYNKEEHAKQVQHIVTQYFMTQRIKPDAKNYTAKVTVLHKMLLAAMKCKQTNDLQHVQTLRSLLKEFEVLYFGHALK